MEFAQIEPTGAEAAKVWYAFNALTFRGKRAVAQLSCCASERIEEQGSVDHEKENI